MNYCIFFKPLKPLCLYQRFKHCVSQQTMKHINIILISLFLNGGILSAQQVWPGDVNNNGIVNEIDFLYWGWAVGAIGAEREDTGTDWQAYPAPAPWMENFPNGLNYYYADCDGDGQVDEQDVRQAIQENFGQTHGTLLPDGFTNATGGQPGPQIQFATNTIVVEPGVKVDIDFSLENNEAAIGNIYGIGLRLNYNPELLTIDEEDDDGDGRGLKWQLRGNSWIRDGNPMFEQLYIDDPDNERAILAITRTDRMSVPIQESIIGSFSIVIEDIILGTEVIDTFKLSVDSVWLVGDQFQNVPTISDEITIFISDDPSSVDTTQVVVSTTNVADEFPWIRLFPNPSRGKFFIEVSTEVNRIDLFDLSGRRIKINYTRIGQDLYAIETKIPLSTGVYLTRVQSHEHIFSQKLIFRKQ